MKIPFLKKSASAQTALLALSMLLAAVSLPARAVDQSGALVQLAGAVNQQQNVGSFYTVSLYLDQKIADTEAVLAGSGTKQLKVVMLRDVKASEMRDVLAKGMVAHASDEELLKLVPVLFGLGEMFEQQKTLAAGDSFLIEWTAAKGTSISIQTKHANQAFEQSFSQPDMFGVMLRLWLGKQPAGSKLKSELSGQAI